MSKISRGEVTGTKMITLWGGPPEWDGHCTAVSASGGGTLERWDHVADAPVVYEATGQLARVTQTKKRRGGDKVVEAYAEVYRYAGYRENCE